MGKNSDIIRIDSVDEEKYLDDKRERFARSIVAGEGLLRAYRNAFGASAARDDELAMNQAITLARVPQVANRITQLESERRVVRNITRESMIADLKTMADVSISDYFNVSGGIWELKHPTEWTNPISAYYHEAKNIPSNHLSSQRATAFPVSRAQCQTL